MADYNLKAEITADASGYEAGVKKAEKASKKLSTTISGVVKGLGKNGLVGALGAVGLASQGFTSTLGAVVKIARKVSETINECTNAYKNQIIAEKALNTAIQNNPFVTGESSKALLQFASDMQKVSNYGDDELIPMMTNLISLGRTEAETMQIMSVAMDMSAGMGISLDSAITQLNATLNGNIGRLGLQNAELKDLTEEELKQGKAVEILGEKFKGLSSATADTSKQLQNIKGDFIEALGQFTLPSSDMWNKFWSGFYEKGIEVINKINAFMDAQIIGRKIANTITEQISKIPESNIAGRADYVRKAIKILTDEELRALGSYLEGSSGYLDIILDHSRKTREEVIAQEEAVNNIANSLTNKIGKEQFSILRNVGQEMENRRIMVRDAKKEAEDKKKQADAEAQITAELQKQEEISKKKTDWASKIIDQRIEMLETERDKAMQLAEEEGRETYTIWRDYNEKILEFKLERLEKEKEKALAEEGLTAEDKIKIEDYYSGETKKIYNDLGNYKKKKNEEEKKDEKSKFAIMAEYAKQYAEKIKQVFTKVVSTIKSIFSGGYSLLKKLFEIKPEEILDNVLKVEDSILTFFAETLPKMPNLITSIVESIAVLLNNVIKLIDANQVRKVVRAILKVITDNLPMIVSSMLIILEELIDALVDGIVEWLDSDEGLEKLLKLILQIQKSLEKVVTKALTKFVDMLDEHKGDFANFLAESMASANRTLPVLIKAILKLINALIEAIAGAFENEDFINSIVESIEKTIDLIIEMIPKLLKSIIKLIVNIITALVPKLPEIIMYVVTAIVEALPSIINDIAKALSKGIAEILKKVFTVDFWGNVLGSFGEILASIIKSAFTGIGDILGGLFGGGSGSFDPLDLIDPLGIRNWFADGTNSAPAGLAVVGEAGPELVRFRGGEQVLNSRNTQKALAGMGGNTNEFNVNFYNTKDTSAYALVSEFKQYNRQMAINGII